VLSSGDLFRITIMWKYLITHAHHTVLLVLQAEGLSQFLLRMLRFHPESRATAEELLNDPWLEGKLPEAPAELTDIASRKRRRPSVPAEDKPPVPPAEADVAASAPAADPARVTVDVARAIHAHQQPTTAHGSGQAAVV
jgi:hypothetical protein